MKKIISILLVIAAVFSLAACGNTVTVNSEEVANVEALINTIGEVSKDSYEALIKAETGYSVLSADNKAAVSNYDVLAAARAEYDELCKEPELVTIDITLDNYLDYFEIVQKRTYRYNAHGEKKGVECADYLILRKDYSAPEGGVDIKVGVEGKEYSYDGEIEFDYDTEEYIEVAVRGRYTSNSSVCLSEFDRDVIEDRYGLFLYMGLRYTQDYNSFYDDLRIGEYEIVSVSGTLTIYA